MNGTARVLLADDHPVVRRGMRLMLDDEADLCVVAEAGDGAEAVERALAERVDLAVLDVSMPRMTGLQAARELARRAPDVRVLVLSMHAVEAYYAEALDAGAAGYVLKSVADRDLVASCRGAIRGATFVHPPGAEETLRRVAERGGRPDALTARELEVLKLVAEGHTTRQIAETLVVSQKTVDRHRANVIEKLGMRDRVDLTRYAIRRGLIEP